jgi:hypothetical protein
VNLVNLGLQVRPLGIDTDAFTGTPSRQLGL